LLKLGGVGVPELVGCDLDRAAEFVGDRVGQPSLETHVESSRVDGESTVGVGVSARQQHGGIGEPLSGADLLGLDHGGEFVVDGDHGVTTHLVVAVTPCLASVPSWAPRYWSAPTIYAHFPAPGPIPHYARLERQTTR
jgi:hypothetical protein